MRCESWSARLKQGGPERVGDGAAYRDRKTSSIEREGNLDDDRSRTVDVRWVFNEIEPHPREWPLVLSDMVNNLRSALDYAVWELAIRDSGAVPERASSISFPVCTTAGEFEAAAKSRLSALSSSSLERVRSVQPFAEPPPVGLDCSDHPLALLHHLSRLDKHRQLHIVRPMLAAFEIGFERDPPGLETWKTDADHLTDGLVLGGARSTRPPWPVELIVTPTLAHGEFVAATEHTPEILFGLMVEATCNWTIRAVAVLNSRSETTSRRIARPRGQRGSALLHAWAQRGRSVANPPGGHALSCDGPDGPVASSMHQRLGGPAISWPVQPTD
jgi:hypothetical protein